MTIMIDTLCSLDTENNIPTLPTLSLSISGLRTRYPTLEVALTPTLKSPLETTTHQLMQISGPLTKITH